MRLERTIFRGELRFRLPAIPSGKTLEKWRYFSIDAEAAADGVVVIFLYSALA